MNNRTRAARVRAINRLMARAKACYEKADVKFCELAASTAVGEVIRVDDYDYAIVDNFASKNVHYRPARVSRYELKRIKDSKPTRERTPDHEQAA